MHTRARALARPHAHTHTHAHTAHTHTHTHTSMNMYQCRPSVRLVQPIAFAESFLHSHFSIDDLVL